MNIRPPNILSSDSPQACPLLVPWCCRQRETPGVSKNHNWQRSAPMLLVLVLSGSVLDESLPLS